MYKCYKFSAETRVPGDDVEGFECRSIFVSMPSLFQWIPAQGFVGTLYLDSQSFPEVRLLLKPETDANAWYHSVSAPRDIC